MLGAKATLEVLEVNIRWLKMTTVWPLYTLHSNFGVNQGKPLTSLASFLNLLAKMSANIIRNSHHPFTMQIFSSYEK